MSTAHVHRQGFFDTLGALAGSQQQENQLSRTFKACFEASPRFRERVLQLVARSCQVRVSAGAEWECLAEVGHHSGGRTDLVLRAPEQPRFTLENKVESVLTLAQLRRYRPSRRRGEYLVAVTKYRPDVPKRDVCRVGACTLRWQDVHRALTAVPVSGAADRFIATAFAEYLEGKDMAYRSTLDRMNLQRAGAMLAASASLKPNTKALSASRAFGALDSLSGMLLDLTFDVRDEFGLAHWGRGGPFYTRQGGAPVLYAELKHGRRGRASYQNVSWGFSLGKRNRLQFSVWWYQGPDNEAKRDSRPLDVGRLVRGQALDHDQLWQALRRQLKQWRFKDGR